MKFTLLYDGELAANGSPAKKQAIREQLHPQLEELWNNHSSLRALTSRRYVAAGLHMWYDTHHSGEPQQPILPKIWKDGKEEVREHVDLCEPVEKKGISFIPIVRERTALRCSLKINFLRQEPPGRIYQGGDIDNRIKTLLDSLSVPQHDEQVIGSSSPIYCLLEDDSLVAGLDVQTQRLLGKANATKHYVHLLIEVDVRVTDPRGYNLMFLGD
jgi:hypothetical protein